MYSQAVSLYNKCFSIMRPSFRIFQPCLEHYFGVYTYVLFICKLHPSLPPLRRGLLVNMITISRLLQSMPHHCAAVREKCGKIPGKWWLILQPSIGPLWPSPADILYCVGEILHVVKCWIWCSFNLHLKTDAGSGWDVVILSQHMSPRPTRRCWMHECILCAGDW